MHHHKAETERPGAIFAVSSASVSSSFVYNAHQAVEDSCQNLYIAELR